MRSAGFRTPSPQARTLFCSSSSDPRLRVAANGRLPSVQSVVQQLQVVSHEVGVWMILSVGCDKDAERLLEVAERADEVTLVVENLADVVQVSRHVGVRGAVDGGVDGEGALGVAERAGEVTLGL